VVSCGTFVRAFTIESRGMLTEFNSAFGWFVVEHGVMRLLHELRRLYLAAWTNVRSSNASLGDAIQLSP
jgi:hypothetical protein